MRSRIPRRSQPSLSSLLAIRRTKVRSLPSFCGQPRTSVLKADCCEGNTHREPGVRYGSDLTLRKRGGGCCHCDRRRYDDDDGSNIHGRQRSGVNRLAAFFLCDSLTVIAFCNMTLKNTLVAVASCDTTCKKSSSSSLLSRMTIKSFAHRDTT